METLFQDLRYGARMLLKQPGFTLIAVIALALGIGANTAIFSVVNAVLLTPLPFAEPDRLTIVYETNLQRGSTRSPASYPNFADWRDQNHAFERMSSYHLADFILTGEGDPALIQGAVVNADLFPLLGVAPILGRSFLPEEDKPGDTGRVVMLSHRLWQTRFNADPNMPGRSLVLDGKHYTVAGVMPAGFQFPIGSDPVELWSTAAIDFEMFAQRGAHYMQVIARLKPDVTLAQAQAEMDGIAGNLEQQYPDENSHRGVNLVPALESMVGDVRPALLILLGAVGCVLLIGCANVANLLLARATTRHKEMAIRVALGASRWRVVRQLLTESVLLSMTGGALGLLMAMWGTDVLVSLSKNDLPRAGQIGLDGRVLGFTFLVSILTGVIFGLVPALHSSKTELTESLKEGGRGSTEGARRNRLRAVLVVGEVAIAIVLLAGAGLLIQSLRRLQQVDPGFNPRNILTFSIGLPSVKYKPEQQIDFYRELMVRIGSLPGVRSASAGYPLPMGGDRMRVTFETEGRPIAKGDLPATEIRTIGLDYFKTLGIPVTNGRDFTERDDKRAPAVVIVNEAFARQFFPGEDPIGKLIKPGITADDEHPTMREIVGVVGNVKHLRLSAEADPEAYEPHAQLTFDMAVLVKTDADPHSIAGAVQGELMAMDKDLPAYNFRTLDEYLSASVAQPRFITLLLAVFAGLALLLTAVGLYGVMSYSVNQRTHEIGIRMALGAGRGDVLKLVVGQGMVLTAIGVVVGLGGAFFLTKLLESLLFGVTATDPATFAAIALLLAGVALAACFVPARRAAKVDPMVALRYE
ncbi:MAG: ABC transporter permease [Acidobacteriota bacterium]